MSKFKICLCIPFINEYNDIEYKREYFTNFANEVYISNPEYFADPYFSYTYDEKLTIGKNAQIELTFNMNKYYYEEDNILLNPFVAKLLNGAIIELTDKNGMLYRMAIKNISYDMKPNNVVISYTAQDFFNYQNSRQNNGYEIVNDSESDSFIGTLNINEWATQYIIPDCKICYSYIPIEDGIYMGTDDTTHHFIKHEWIDNNVQKSAYCVLTNDIYIKTNKPYYTQDNKLYWIEYNSNNAYKLIFHPDGDIAYYNANVKGKSNFPIEDSSFVVGTEYYNTEIGAEDQLILPKELYDSTHRDYSEIGNVKWFIKKPIENTKDNEDYYQSIIFSCSGSSAANALISLGEQLGMMINVDYFHNWIWFTDIKNPTYTGLSYSPNVDLQTVGVSSDGESLATVVNVSGPTIGDDLVTLLPTLPAFFRSYFQTKDWEESTWHSGLFNEICSANRAYVPNRGEDIYQTVIACSDSEDPTSEYNIKTDSARKAKIKVKNKRGNYTYYLFNQNSDFNLTGITYTEYIALTDWVENELMYNVVYFYTTTIAEETLSQHTYFYRADINGTLRKYIGFDLFCPTCFNHYDNVGLSELSVLKFVNHKENIERTYSIFDLEEEQKENHIILSDLSLSPTKDTILAGKRYENWEIRDVDWRDIEWADSEHTIIKEGYYYGIPIEFSDSSITDYNLMYTILTPGIKSKKAYDYFKGKSNLKQFIKTPGEFNKSTGIPSGTTFFEQQSTNSFTDIAVFLACLLFSIYCGTPLIFTSVDSSDLSEIIKTTYKNYYDLQGNLLTYVGETEVNPENNSYYELQQTESGAATGYSFSTTGIHPLVLIDVDYLPEGDITDWKMNDSDQLVYVSFNREASQEEKNFAEIADCLPYLENKIIKVEYLRKVFSKDTYEGLEDIVYNKLRINNGLLLYYYLDYVAGLSLKTQRLAELVNACDLLGATTMSEITNDTSAKFTISKDVTSDNLWGLYKNSIYSANLETSVQYNETLNTFGLTYNATTKEWIKPASANKVKIQGWNDILSSYGRKYYNSYQAFMKNIYNFRKFWDSKIDFISTDGVEWTNGQYYIKHKDSTDLNIIEKVALIETTLTGFWTSAYNASLNGHYFLPEKWQPATINATGEYTCGQINVFNVIKNGQINSEWVPEIAINQSKGHECIYTYNENAHNLDDIEDWMYDLDTVVKYYDSEESIYKYYSLWDKAVAENTSIVTYKITDGGKTWLSLISEVCMVNDVTKDTTEAQIEELRNKYKALYKYFDGSYIIIFKIIKDCMIDKSTEKYRYYQNQNKKIWQQIHKDFGMLILESNFTSDNAVDAQSLLQQAMAYYKDYEKPQTKYSLSIIDIAQLQGYSTIPLAIGDQIALVSQHFYQEEDAIKQLFEERLFINEISYDLRKDSDISIGVDTVSYQDKLIGKLVKLIK